MGKTFKDNRMRERRALQKTINEHRKTVPVEFYPEAVNPIARELSDKMEALNRSLMNGFKEEYQHSASFRKTSARTKKRCGRVSKHSANRTAMKDALDFVK